MFLKRAKVGSSLCRLSPFRPSNRRGTQFDAEKWRRPVEGEEEGYGLAGCSKGPSSKAAASYRLIRGGWDDPCARPTRVFRGRALREHGDRPSHPDPFFQHPVRNR
jgi:hypothetical protein